MPSDEFVEYIKEQQEKRDRGELDLSELRELMNDEFILIDNPSPMDLEENIRWSLLIYPSLHPNRGSVLHHMYFCIGNGYEWINGQLIDKFFDPKLAQRFLDEAYKLPIPERKSEDVLKLLSEKRDIGSFMEIVEFNSNIDSLLLLLAVRDEVDIRIKDPTFGVRHKKDDERYERIHGKSYEWTPYPICEEYARFWTIPEDAKVDYIKGAIEAGKQYLRYSDDERITSQLKKLREMWKSRT